MDVNILVLVHDPLVVLFRYWIVPIILHVFPPNMRYLSYPLATSHEVVKLTRSYHFSRFSRMENDLCIIGIQKSAVIFPHCTYIGRS